MEITNRGVEENAIQGRISKRNSCVESLMHVIRLKNMMIKQYEEPSITDKYLKNEMPGTSEWTMRERQNGY